MREIYINILISDNCINILIMRAMKIFSNSCLLSVGRIYPAFDSILIRHWVLKRIETTFRAIKIKQLVTAF